MARLTQGISMKTNICDLTGQTHRMEKETTCKHCGKVFTSQGKYRYHYRVKHRNQVNAPPRGAISPPHGSQDRENPKQFPCICGKSSP